MPFFQDEKDFLTLAVNAGNRTGGRQAFKNILTGPFQMALETHPDGSKPFDFSGPPPVLSCFLRAWETIKKFKGGHFF